MWTKLSPNYIFRADFGGGDVLFDLESPTSVVPVMNGRIDLGKPHEL